MATKVYAHRYQANYTTGRRPKVELVDQRDFQLWLGGTVEEHLLGTSGPRPYKKVETWRIGRHTFKGRDKAELRVLTDEDAAELARIDEAILELQRQRSRHITESFDRAPALSQSEVRAAIAAEGTVLEASGVIVSMGPEARHPFKR